MGLDSQPRTKDGRWASTGFKTDKVHVKAVGKDPGQKSAQYHAGRAASYATRHHKSVTAYQNAKSDVERAKHALTAANTLKKMRASVKAAKAAATTEEELHHAHAAEMMLAQAAVRHAVVQPVHIAQAKTAKKEAKKAKDDDEDEDLPDELGDQDGGGKSASPTYDHATKLSDAAEAVSAAVSSTSAPGVQLGNHKLAAQKHKDAAKAYKAVGMHDKAAYHEAVAANHQKKANELAAHQEFGLPPPGGNYTYQTPAPSSLAAQAKVGQKPKTPEELVAHQKKEMDGAKLHEEAEALLKEANEASAAGDANTAAGKFALAQAKAQEAMTTTANPEKSSEVYKQAQKVHQKAKVGKSTAEYQAKLAQEKAAYEDQGSQYKREQIAAFQQRRKAFTAALPEKERNDCQTYSGGSYQRINGGLRGGKPQGSSQKLEAEVAGLDAALARPEAGAPMDMIVYRGFSGASYYRDVGVGSEFQDHAYQSTSVDPNKSFGGDVKLHISVPQGHPAAPIPSHHPHEVERLLPRGQRYRVTKREVIGGTLHLHVEALPYRAEDKLGYIVAAQGNAGLAQESAA